MGCCSGLFSMSGGGPSLPTLLVLLPSLWSLLRGRSGGGPSLHSMLLQLLLLLGRGTRSGMEIASLLSCSPSLANCESSEYDDPSWPDASAASPLLQAGVACSCVVGLFQSSNGFDGKDSSTRSSFGIRVVSQMVLQVEHTIVTHRVLGHSGSLVILLL
jgi:hypothetical protein